MAALPAEGLTLRYALNAPAAGTYTAWARVGFEWVRAPIEWRVTDAKGTLSAWQKIEPTQATTNVKRLAFWMEVAWQKLGEVALPAGAAQLELRFREPNKDRLLFALDAVALVKGQWTPEGKLKPGEEFSGERDMQAARQIYSVPKADNTAGARSEVSLNGLWQAARYDDADMDIDTYTPVKVLPKNEEYGLHWKGVKVPGSAWDDDELAFGHRLIYRTKLNVPAELRWTPPAVAKRQDATLILRVSQGGKVGFEDSKEVAIFPALNVTPQVLAAQKIALQDEARSLLVWDRSDKLAPWLQARGMKFQSVANLDELKNRSGLLLIGPNSLTAEEAFGTGVLAFATRGNRVIVLEQQIPLAGAALPQPIRATNASGSFAFSTALATPLFAGLESGDLQDWRADGPTFTKAYENPAGARTLVEAGTGLNNAAMLNCRPEAE